VGEALVPQASLLRRPAHFIWGSIWIEELRAVELELLLLGDVGRKRRPTGGEGERDIDAVLSSQPARSLATSSIRLGRPPAGRSIGCIS
jgi:hypothetical protein